MSMTGTEYGMGRLRPDGPHGEIFSLTDPWDDGISTYILLVDFYGKCRGKYTVPPMDPSWGIL